MREDKSQNTEYRYLYLFINAIKRKTFRLFYLKIYIKLFAQSSIFDTKSSRDHLLIKIQRRLIVIVMMFRSLLNILLTLIIITFEHLFATRIEVQFKCCPQIKIENKGQEIDGLYELNRIDYKWMQSCLGG